MNEVNWGIFWDALSAIATTAAVIVALDLARKDETRRKVANEQAAQLSAASITQRLSGTDSAIASLIARIVFDDSPYDPEFNLRFNLAHMQEVLRGPLFKPSADDLVALIPLGGGCAHRIAKAFDIIGSVTDMISPMDVERLEFMFVHRVLDKSLTQLKTARELLQAAVGICNTAAAKGAPDLSLEEIHGPEFD